MSRQAELTDGSKPIRVVAGILCDKAGRVLITDRSRARFMQDYWEFPGGKVKPEESLLDALQRELREELGVLVTDATHLQTIDHDYPEMSVTVDFFIVRQWHESAFGREGQQLRWVDKRALRDQQLLPADAPVVMAINQEV